MINTNLVFDSKRLTDIVGINTPAYDQILSIFVTEVEATLKEIECDLQNHDSNQLKRHIHRLKGSTGNCGANVMYRLSLEMEEKIPSEDWQELFLIFNQVKNAYTDVKKEMNLSSKK